MQRILTMPRSHANELTPKVQDAETTECSGLPMAIRLQHSLESLDTILNKLSAGLNSENGITTTFLAEEIKRIRDQQERMLSEFARQDALLISQGESIHKLAAEVTRAHKRLDTAADFMKKHAAPPVQPPPAKEG
jgi:hypothetical protein